MSSPKCKAAISKAKIKAPEIGGKCWVALSETETESETHIDIAYGMYVKLCFCWFGLVRYQKLKEKKKKKAGRSAEATVLFWWSNPMRKEKKK